MVAYAKGRPLAKLEPDGSARMSGWISNTDKDVGVLLLGEFIDGELRYSPASRLR